MLPNFLPPLFSDEGYEINCVSLGLAAIYMGSVGANFFSELNEKKLFLWISLG